MFYSACLPILPKDAVSLSPCSSLFLLFFNFFKHLLISCEFHSMHPSPDHLPATSPHIHSWPLQTPPQNNTHTHTHRGDRKTNNNNNKQSIENISSLKMEYVTVSPTECPSVHTSLLQMFTARSHWSSLRALV